MANCGKSSNYIILKRKWISVLPCMTLFPDRLIKNLLFPVALSHPIRLELARLRECFPILWVTSDGQWTDCGVLLRGNICHLELVIRGIFLLYEGLWPNHTTGTVCCQFTKVFKRMEPLEKFFLHFIISIYALNMGPTSSYKTWSCTTAWFKKWNKSSFCFKIYIALNLLIWLVT